MPVDLFRLIDIRNRRAFNIEGREGKVYRTRLIEKTQEIEADLRNVLASNYLSSIGGPNYTIALRAYAIEFAKISLTLEDLEGDTYNDTEAYGDNRADLVYQKLGSLLGVDRDLQLNIFSSQEFHDFLLSMVEIFFGGSTPANIVRAIELFVGEEGVVTLSENFKDARNPLSAYDISDQFGFRVDFELTERISREFTDLGVKLDFLLKMIKPAHTLFVLRFIFTEICDILQNADDTFVIDNIWDHSYDDMRRYCAGVSGRDRLGVNKVKEAVEDFTGMAGTVIYTTYGPISKNSAVPEVGGVTDVTVTVDGSAVPILDVEGAAGIIYLVAPVLPSQTVTVTYYYWRNAEYGLLLNRPGRVIWGGLRDKFPATWVLNKVHDHQPALVEWSYQAYERNYTADLNDPTALVLNEPPNQISDQTTGRIYGHRHVLNWANYVWSPDQVDLDGYRHLLNEGTPIVELREALPPIFEWEGPTGQCSGAWGSGNWGCGPWGGGFYPPIQPGEEYQWWNIIFQGGMFIPPLETETTTTGDEGLLTIACDTGLMEMSIDTPFEDQYEWPVIPYCDNTNLFIFNQSVVNGDDLLNNFSGVAGCEVTATLASEIPFSDVSPVPSTATDDPPHEVEMTASESRGESYDLTGMFVMNQSAFNGSDVLFDNEQLGHWSDEGHIGYVMGGFPFHLDSYSNQWLPGPP